MQLGVLHSHARIHGVGERELDRPPEQVRDRCMDLVAPVLDPSGHRRAYFPEGIWQDWWTGEVIEGSRWLDLDMPLDQIPLWLRAGRVVPLAPLIEHVDQRRIDRLEVRLLPGVAVSYGRVVSVDDERTVTILADRGADRPAPGISGADVDVVVASLPR
jgi:hypothetical protein